MRAFCYAALASITPMLAGCATYEPTFADNSLSVLEIDTDRNVYSIGGEKRTITSCETESFHCLELQGVGVIAMFKDCSAYSDRFAVPGIRGIYYLHAPGYHLSPPAGGFFNSEDPSVVFAFNRRDGLYRIDLSEHGPGEAVTGSERVVKKYRVRSSDGRKMFECKGS